MNTGRRGSWIVLGLLTVGVVAALLVKGEMDEQRADDAIPAIAIDEIGGRASPEALPMPEAVPVDEAREVSPDLDEGAERPSVDGETAEEIETAEAELDPRVQVISLRGAPRDEEPQEPPPVVEQSETEPDERERFSLSRDGIRDAIGSVRGEIRDCYEAWLNFEEEIEGRLVLGIKVETEGEPGTEDAEGRVSEVEIQDTEFDHPLLEGCIANTIGELRFDAPSRGGEVQITYPFVFRMGGNN